MSQVIDDLNALDADVDTFLSNTAANVAKWTAQVAALQAQIDAGNNDPAVLALVASIKAKIDAANPTNPTVLPTP